MKGRIGFDVLLINFFFPFNNDNLHIINVNDEDKEVIVVFNNYDLHKHPIAIS